MWEGKKMTKPTIHYNAMCFCGGVNPEMIRVGAVIMCESCYCITFETDDPVKKERDFYLELLAMRDEF